MDFDDIPASEEDNYVVTDAPPPIPDSLELSEPEAYFGGESVVVFPEPEPVEDALT
jgi:hypothetical protein